MFDFGPCSLQNLAKRHLLLQTLVVYCEIMTSESRALTTMDIPCFAVAEWVRIVCQCCQCCSLFTDLDLSLWTRRLGPSLGRVRLKFCIRIPKLLKIWSVKYAFNIGWITDPLLKPFLLEFSSHRWPDNSYSQYGQYPLRCFVDACTFRSISF